MLKIFQARLQQHMTENFQRFELDLEKAQEPEIKMPTSPGSQKNQRNSRKTSTSASLKPFMVWITNCKMKHKSIKIARRNNNLRYPDDTTLMAENEEDLKILLMQMKEDSEKDGLKCNIQKTKMMAPGPITSWQMDGETMETMTYFIFLGSKITADGD